MKINEVSKMFDITKDTLRYYEKQGLIGPIKKTSGIRDYDDYNLRQIEFIKCMRTAFVPISVLKEYMDLYKKGKSTRRERMLLLGNQRNILEDNIKKMNNAYKKLNKKIDLYKQGKLEEYLERK